MSPCVRDLTPDEIAASEKCGPTHHLGCACHEARRDAEVAELRAEVERLKGEMGVLRQSVAEDYDIFRRTLQRDANQLRRLRADRDRRGLSFDTALVVVFDTRPETRGLVGLYAKDLWEKVKNTQMPNYYHVTVAFVEGGSREERGKLNIDAEFDDFIATLTSVRIALDAKEVPR